MRILIEEEEEEEEESCLNVIVFDLLVQTIARAPGSVYLARLPV